tara:strand:- start:3031 stop:3489 length:459 start_codon:yes stop_codon:yes gene_type:complete
MNSENPEVEKTQSLLNITYDVSDPTHPEAIRIQNKTRSKNAERQARYRKKLEEKGKVKAQIYIPEDKKNLLEDIAKRLSEGEDVAKTEELKKLNDNISGLTKQLEKSNAETKRLREMLEKAQNETNVVRKEKREVEGRIDRVPSIVKWFCGI